MKSKYIRLTVLSLLIASFALYLGCESDVSVGSLALTVVKGESGIVANDKDFATIEATVTGFDDAVGGLGTKVDFATTLGYFANGRSTITLQITGSDGKVKTYLWAPKGTGQPDQLDLITIDTAVVSGTVEDTTQFVKIPIIGCKEDNEPAKIKLAASPDTIPADGETSSAITATVTDCEQEGVIDEDIEFVTDKGLFSNDKMRIIKTTRDSSGTVEAYLIALKGTPLGPAKIEARSKTNPQVIGLVTVKIGARPASITLTASDSCIAPDGLEFSTITATVKDYQGTAVPPGTSVTFETLVGVFSNGGNSITVSTDSSGAAVAHFIAPVGTPPQTAQITAIAMGVSARVVVEISDSCT